MHMHFHCGPPIMALLKHFKRNEPSKEERTQSVLAKPDGPLAHASSAIEATNNQCRTRNEAKLGRWVI